MLKTGIKGLLVLMLGMNASAWAMQDYFPAERIHCTINSQKKLSCEGFNRNFLTESIYAANLTQNEPLVFNFAAGFAYQDSTGGWRVRYVYTDSANHAVYLKTVSPSIHPALEHSAWVKKTENRYECFEGYMSCPISV